MSAELLENVATSSLPTLDADVENIQKLDDEPNDVGGLTAAQLKAEFDKGNVTIKKWINETFIPSLNQSFDDKVPITRTINGHPLDNDVEITKGDIGLGNVDNTSDEEKPVSTAQQEALDLKANKTDVIEKNNTTEYTPTENYHPATKRYVDKTLADAVLGNVPDGSITPAKLDRVYAEIGEDGKVIPSQINSAVIAQEINANQVGDILTTARTDLGDSWLLCNGARVSREYYHKLSELLPEDYSVGWDWYNNPLIAAIGTDNISSNGNLNLGGMVFVNGKIVVVGQYLKKTGSVYSAFLASTSDISSNDWDVQELFTDPVSNGSPKITGLFYENGYYIILARLRSGSSAPFTYKVRIYYGKELGGSFAYQDVWSTQGSDLNYIQKILYANGYYVLIGSICNSSTNNYPRIIVGYTTALGSSWNLNSNVFHSSGVMTTTSRNVPGDIIFDGECFILVAGVEYNYSSSIQAVPTFAYSNDDTPLEWTVKSGFLINRRDSYPDGYRLYYADGLYILFSMLNSGKTVYADYTENIKNGFSYYPAQGPFYLTAKSFSGMIYDGKKFVWFGLIEDTDLGHRLYAFSSKKIKDYPFEKVLCDGSAKYSSGFSVNNTSAAVYTDTKKYIVANDLHAEIDFNELDGNKLSLPSISSDRAYNYIKALEG